MGNANTKHTPGPWRAEPNRDETLVQICGGSSFDTCVVNLDLEGPEGVRTKQHMPNAHLIAAAPDLLDALKTTLGNLLSLKHNAFKNFDTLDNWIAEVEAAIVKAGGK